MAGAPIGNTNNNNGRLFTQAMMNVVAEHPQGRMAGLMAIIRPQVQKAWDGDTEAAKLVIDRIAGKAHQSLTVDGDSMPTIMAIKMMVVTDNSNTINGLRVIEGEASEEKNISLTQPGESDPPTPTPHVANLGDGVRGE